jgi:septal ring factor EnvC (AmiA/AmiB activator)
MDETTQNNAPDTPDLAGQMAQATQSLADALHNLDSQFASLHAKIDRIVAAVDDGDPVLQASARNDHALRSKVAELEKTNHDLKAQAATARRKTLSPMVSALLAKQGVDGDAVIETPIIEKALAGLSIEQRIAVKNELARAGILA